MDVRKLKIYFQTKTDFLDDFLPKGSLCYVRTFSLHKVRENTGLGISFQTLEMSCLW